MTNRRTVYVGSDRGMGDVFGDDRWLARASYVLDVYREDAVVGGDVLQGKTDTRGTLSVEDGESMLVGREGLTLRTDDGVEYRIIVAGTFALGDPLPIRAVRMS